jgi:hypothetical protein
MMVPTALASPAPLVDVTAAMDEQPQERSLVLRTVPSGPPDDDPFAAVSV